MKKPNASARISPPTTAAQQAEMPKCANFFTSKKIKTILKSCSAICVRAFGVTFLRAIKYPRMQEEIPINGRANGSSFKAVMERISSSKYFAINSAPKNTAAAEINAIIKVISTERLKILVAPFLLPTASSSAVSFVTAVTIPLEAKVDTKR